MKIKQNDFLIQAKLHTPIKNENLKYIKSVNQKLVKRASVNCAMYQMHNDTNRSTVTNSEENNILHKTKNRFDKDDSDIFSICEQPHLVATTCNDLAHPGFDKIFHVFCGNVSYYLSPLARIAVVNERKRNSNTYQS